MVASYASFGRSAAASKVAGVLAKYGLGKYENVLNRRLSGGVKRRVLMTIILVTDAKILFVDEAEDEAPMGARARAEGSSLCVLSSASKSFLET
jgi:ABC-type nitrate/sulfonate/bicarbonate transport system ATPase subunit